MVPGNSNNSELNFVFFVGNRLFNSEIHIQPSHVKYTTYIHGLIFCANDIFSIHTACGERRGEVLHFKLFFEIGLRGSPTNPAATNGCVA